MDKSESGDEILENKTAYGVEEHYVEDIWVNLSSGKELPHGHSEMIIQIFYFW